jgi:DNA-binding transcriptional LysR family regulator
MDIKQLSYFVAIAEEGNITAAAKRLHISQPPLSIQLKALEQELGVILVERGARSVTLTDAGRLLYKHACQIISLTNTAVKELADFDNGVKGTLRLGTISSSGTALLTGRLQNYHRDNPNIDFEIHEGNTYQLLELLSNNVIEIAVIRTPFQAENIVCHYLEKEPMAAVAHHSFFQDTPEEHLAIPDLAGFPLIYYRRYEKLIQSVFDNYQITPNIFCKNDDARTTLLWAKAGMGVAIMPKSAAEMIPSTKLTVKTIDEPSLSSQIAAVYRKNTPLSPAAVHFIELFHEQLRL